ncbi:hypothetical protein Plo01_44890 [Planobispora longispora]|uniref:Uncharacterized protein n=1 Tax=Planobispora longispora TaxID=28887 RepID=A0A8J3RN52_9ACTN|nr:hypothetical protein GCM10020093_022690 [Planobispora longispora]GIH78060.1 hypothetical protein Plo01_44890 [Planobispora longispora]
MRAITTTYGAVAAFPAAPRPALTIFADDPEGPGRGRTAGPIPTEEDSLVRAGRQPARRRAGDLGDPPK